MSEMKLGVVESRFADIIWANEPLATGALIAMCKEELKWQRTTTYTVLKRLSERGLFQNEGGVVTSLVSREEFYSVQSEHFVDETFHGSLPAFLAAFTQRKNLTVEDVSQIRKLIDAWEEE